MLCAAMLGGVYSNSTGLVLVWVRRMTHAAERAGDEDVGPDDILFVPCPGGIIITSCT
jgi:hypothetical protein